MAKRFDDLRAQMTPEARARATARADAAAEPDDDERDWSPDFDGADEAYDAEREK